VQIDQKQASEDLAFLRAIVEERSASFKQTGLIYGAAGLLYGAECLTSWLDIRGTIALSNTGHLIAHILPTGLFLAIMIGALWKNRPLNQSKGTASRAMEAVFGAAGLANLVMIVVFGLTAWQRQDFSIWLFYPAVVCAFQGAAWYVVTIVQKRLWMWAPTIGWFGTAMIAGLLTDNPERYLVVLGTGLILFMFAPGLILYRSRKT
jgi:hypothetical protein